MDNLIAMILLMTLLIGITLILYYIWDNLQIIVTEGEIIAKKYEATQNRYYYVIAIHNDPIEYFEYDCLKTEWMMFKEGDTVECEVSYNEFNTIIKSIKKND